MEWNQKQQNAIISSIKHWKDNVEALKKVDRADETIGGTCSTFHRWTDPHHKKIASYSADACQLCIEFSGLDCKECPLHIIGDNCNGPDSSWKTCRYATGNSDIIAAAENMFKVLRDLLKVK